MELHVGDHTILFDEQDASLIAGHQWNVSWKGRAWYAQSTRGTGRVYMHRLLLGLKVGDRQRADHRNGDTLDNRRSNLRLATQAQNALNRGPSAISTSGFKGTYLDKRDGRWYCRVVVDGKVLSGGRFDTAEEAASAYDDLARQHYGEFAVLNFP